MEVGAAQGISENKENEGIGLKLCSDPQLTEILN